ncbi:YfhO family protein [Tellurirhabdus rosea]|uniref:YfhO family protein n=1 Tax=Tellurirhabdus rosea TaxID=2674997 RepID=UPI00225467DF|nr:YfhO family protein [Tellurirhabdus rosea]
MNFKRFLPHLFAVIGFAVLAILYASPVLNGKRLNQHDIIQSVSAAREVVEFHKQTGERSWWTNSMFGGMPTYMIAGDYPTSLTTKLGQYINLLLPDPANYLWLIMLGGYILMVSLGMGVWLSALGAVAYGFASYHLLSLEAGHVSKVLAIAYAPGVLAGIILALRGRYLAGAALTALFLGLELYANHIQITYYLAVGILIFIALESVKAIREGRIRHLLLAGSSLAVAALIAVGTHTTRLWSAADYSTVTTRGKSELTIAPPNAPGDAAGKVSSPKSGLDKDYAFQYSYGKGETFTLLVPNFAGGASVGSLTTDSETYKKLTSIGVDAGMAQQFIQQIPLYHGVIYATGGPAYAGAIVVFLFVLGLLTVRGPLKWWALATFVLYVVWSWGKNFEAVNYFFFDYFPGFNKFRAVTMVLSLAQIPMVVLGMVGLKQLLEKKQPLAEINRSLLISLGVTGGLSLLMALVPTVFASFRGVNDEQFVASLEQGFQNRELANQVMAALIDDRIGLFRSDAFRSAVLILLPGGLLWLYLRDKLKTGVLYPALLLLVIFDLFGVDKRYLNNDDFISKSAIQQTLAPSPADEQILADKDPNFRVLDLTTSFMSDARASYFHKSLGGYHAAKMRRYQELIEYQVAGRNNQKVVDMLNTRYILGQGQGAQGQPGAPTAQLNPGAYGNAWFVNEYRLVPDANAEMKAMDALDPRRTAVVDQRFADQLQGLTIQPDSAANTIRLTKYKPNELTYESNARTEQLAVFSEIYYNVRDDWKVTIDGKEVPHLRADYVLRALRVPAGKHTIVFRFDPVSISAGKTIDLVASILLVAFIGLAFFAENRRRKSADVKERQLS